ncbi:MAG: 2Fe-2S iron-sulfur cluster-binding protein [Gemmataceae bacterium]
MKRVELQPVGTLMEVSTGSRLLDGLLAMKYELDMACGGKGLCATCHVRVRFGEDELTPRTPREERTLGLVDGADESSRLACQCHVLGEGIVVELPEGVYLQSADAVAGLIGTKAEFDYLHPITGKVLIGKGKIITRTILQLFVTLSEDLRKLRDEN